MTSECVVTGVKDSLWLPTQLFLFCGHNLYTNIKAKQQILLLPLLCGPFESALIMKHKNEPQERGVIYCQCLQTTSLYCL